MSLYVLDTDTLSLWQRGHPKVTAEVSRRSPQELAVTVISVQEQLNGRFRVLRRAKRADQVALAYRNLTETVRFFARVAIISFEEPAVLRFEQLRKLKLRVGPMDLRIAAIALEHGATVVTHNLTDFQRIPGLTIVGWSV